MFQYQRYRSVSLIVNFTMFQILGVIILVDTALSMAPLVDNSTQAPEKVSTLYNNYKKRFENSTSCEELLYNYTFDPISIVNEDWKRFYFWNSNDKPLHMFRFSVPYPIVCIFIFLLTFFGTTA